MTGGSYRREGTARAQRSNIAGDQGLGGQAFEGYRGAATSALEGSPHVHVSRSKNRRQKRVEKPGRRGHEGESRRHRATATFGRVLRALSFHDHSLPASAIATVVTIATV